jgi:hypothetical protein
MKKSQVLAREMVSETVKTSVKLPKMLWREASVRALDEGRGLQDVIASALELYLKSAPARGGAR